MNYQKIAELVYEMVKKPESLVQNNGLFSEENKNEFIHNIQRVFSKLEVSGDILTFETMPLDYW